MDRARVQVNRPSVHHLTTFNLYCLTAGLVSAIAQRINSRLACEDSAHVNNGKAANGHVKQMNGYGLHMNGHEIGKTTNGTANGVANGKH